MYVHCGSCPNYFTDFTPTGRFPWPFWKIKTSSADCCCLERTAWYHV